MRNFICILSLSMGFAVSVHAQTKTDLLEYQPQRFTLDERDRAVLDGADWHSKASLEAIPQDALAKILSDQISSFRDRDKRIAAIFPIINHANVVDLKHDGHYSIVLWLNDAVVMSFGAILVKEDRQYSLVYFNRDIYLEDLDRDGRSEIVVTYPIIYKEGRFWGADTPIASIYWYDVFVLNGTVQKADAQFPAFYRATVAKYRKYQENIRKFDFKGYVVRNKAGFADPDAWEKWTLSRQEIDLQILATAISAAETVLKNK